MILIREGMKSFWWESLKLLWLPWNLSKEFLRLTHLPAVSDRFSINLIKESLRKWWSEKAFETFSSLRYHPRTRTNTEKLFWKKKRRVIAGSKAHDWSFRVLSRLPHKVCCWCCWLLCRVFLLISSVSMCILLCFLLPLLLFHILFYTFMKCEHAIGARWFKFLSDTTKTKPLSDCEKWQQRKEKLRLLCSLLLYLLFSFLLLCLSGSRQCCNEDTRTPPTKIFYRNELEFHLQVFILVCRIFYLNLRFSSWRRQFVFRFLSTIDKIVWLFSQLSRFSAINCDS